MRATTRSPVWLFTLSLTLALGAAACARKKDDDKKDGTAGKVGEGAAAAGERGHKPRQGGHLVLPAGSGPSEPRYLNPILETRFTRANALIFEGLVGLSSALEPVPVLAESWQSSADGKKLTFKLRSGVKWQDGKPFTSKDVQFTFQAIRDTTAPTLWKTYFAAVEKLETPDDQTVVVTYSRPYAPALIAWTVGIIPAHVYGGGQLTESKGNQAPVGTGPFRLARWEPGKSLLFEANRGWWNGRPNLDQVTLRVDVDDPLKALRAGEVDFTQVPDVAVWSTEAQVPDFRADFEVATSHGSLFRTLGWNLQKPPFDDKKVRLALTLALNRSRIIEDVFLNQAQAMSAPLYPNMIGSDPSIAPHPFDLGKAAVLLDEAGHKAGPSGRFAVQVITVASQKTATTEEMFAIFRRDYAAIGIDLKVEYLSPKDFEARVVMRDFDAVYFGWFPDIPDPDPSALLHSSQIKVGQNFAGYADPDVDKLLESAVATSNRDERKALYQKLHAKLAADLPYTVLYAPYSHFAWSRRVHGVSPDDIGPQPRFPGIAGWWVE
jgi:peptide/nickel transport system substrate-binding protein